LLGKLVERCSLAVVCLARAARSFLIGGVRPPAPTHSLVRRQRRICPPRKDSLRASLDLRSAPRSRSNWRSFPGPIHSFGGVMVIRGTLTRSVLRRTQRVG